MQELPSINGRLGGAALRHVGALYTTSQNSKKTNFKKNIRIRTKWLRIYSWQKQNRSETKALNGQNEIRLHDLRIRHHNPKAKRTWRPAINSFLQFTGTTLINAREGATRLEE